MCSATRPRWFTNFLVATRWRLLSGGDKRFASKYTVTHATSATINNSVGPIPISHHQLLAAYATQPIRPIISTYTAILTQSIGQSNPRAYTDVTARIAKIVDSITLVYWEYMQDSIFTKIIKGDIPSHKIYEDEKTFAFLDIYPDEEGHTLLVPKTQVDKIYDLDDEEYANLWLIAKKIARHYEQATGKRVIFKVIGVDVPHAHIHLIPYDPKNHQDHGQQQAKKMASEPDHGALASVAQQLAL